MNFLPDAALFLLLVFALVTGGWAWSGRDKPSLEAAIVPGAAFLGVYALLIWAVGSLWRLVPPFWIALPWPLWMVLLVWKRENLLHHARRAASLPRLAPLDRALSFYLLGLFSLTFVLCLAPPSGADYDSLVYHLAVPAQYLRVGRVVELPYDHHSYFPLTLEMLYTLGLAARGAASGAVFAKLFHWLMLPIGALALVAIGKRAHSARAGLWAACLFASMPLTLQESTTAYIDLGFAAFAFLAILSFVAASEPQENAAPTWSWVWCGVFCGLCLGTKYLGWLIFGFLGVYFLFSSLKNRAFSARQLASFALPALIIGLPWYLRNAFWTGNPVFPFAYSIFGGRGWTSAMAVTYDASQAKYGFGHGLPDLLMLPWRLAMTPLNIGAPFWPLLSEPVRDGFDGLFEVQGLCIDIFPGPAVVALGFAALLCRDKPRAITLCATFFGFLWLFWALTSQQIRYLLPALGILSLVGGWGAAHYAPRFRVARAVGALGLGGWLLFAPAFLLWRSRPTFAVISGAISSDDYRLRAFSGTAAMNYANRNTPPNAKFAVFGEPRDFYLDRAYFWADDPHNNLIDYSKVRSGADFAGALRALGATHVLWNVNAGRNGGVFGPPAQIDDAIARGDLRLLLGENEGRGYRIYAIAPR